MGLPTSVCAQSAVERVAPLKVLQNDQELLVHEFMRPFKGKARTRGAPAFLCG